MLLPELEVGFRKRIIIPILDERGIEKGTGVFRLPNGVMKELSLDVKPRDGQVTLDIPISRLEDLGLLEGNGHSEWILTEIRMTDITGKNVSRTGLNIRLPISMNSKIPSLKVSTTHGSLFPGEKARLMTEFLPADFVGTALKYSSNNKNITVSPGGILQGNKVGIAIITVSSKSDPNLKASVTIAVKKFTKISALKTVSSMKLKKGDKKRISVSVSPSSASNKNLTFSVSEKGIIRVDNGGNITGLKAGKVRLDVKATDGSGKKAVCYITVTE